MNRSRASSEPAPGEFRSFEDFLSFARGKCDYKAKFHFTRSDGKEIWLEPYEAIDTLEKIRKFMSAPDAAACPALDDGRMIVAHHNHANLTQHLRWACELDADTKPRKRPGGRVYSPNWPGTALLWFWSNGGVPLDGFAGTYEQWQASLPKKQNDVLCDVERHVKEVPGVVCCEEAVA